MSTMNPGPSRPTRPAADSDVYTALMAISALFLLVSTIYVIVRALALTGSILPPGGS